MNTTEELSLETDETKPDALLEEPPPPETLRSSLFRQFVLMPLFVVIVFAIVVGSILLLGRIATEARSARECLIEVKTSSGTARWQAALNLVHELEKTQHSPEVKELVPEIESILRQAEGDDEDKVRLRFFMLQALGWVADEEAMEFLAAYCRDPVVDVRGAALMSAMKVSNARAVPLLVVALKDEEPEIRSQAALQLGYLKAPTGIPPLVVALNDPKEDVKLNAAWALAECGHGSAIPALTRGLERDYLAAIYGKDPGKTRTALCQSIAGLVKLGHSEAVATIRRISAEDPDLKVRDEAIKALSAFGK